MPPSRLVPRLEVAQLHPQHARLEGVESAVEAWHEVVIFLALSVVSEHANRVRQTRVVGHDHSAVAVCAQILGRVKAKRGHVAQGSNRSTLVARAVSLARILDDAQVIVACNLENWIHVSRLTVQVNGDDCPGSGGNCPLNTRYVERIRVGVHIDQDRPGAGVGDCQGCCDEGVGGGNDLVARADVAGSHRELERRRTRVHAYSQANPAESGEFVLELLQLAPQDVVGSAQHPSAGLFQLIRNAGVLSRQVNERHRWCMRLCDRCCRSGARLWPEAGWSSVHSWSSPT